VAHGTDQDEFFNQTSSNKSSWSIVIEKTFGGQHRTSAQTPQRLNVIRVTRYTTHPYVIHFKCAPNFGEAQGGSSLGKVKTEHPEFPMDPRRSPGWVFNDHTKD
jgi:hypothetical protein